MAVSGSQEMPDGSNLALDHKQCSQLMMHINTLTTSGLPKLDEAELKKIKKISKQSDSYVEYTFDKLQKRLEEDHSEIRLSAFQIMNELFVRSHRFRELMVADMQLFLELTVETNVELPLPPPKAAAKLLKEQVLRAIVEWNEKYGKAYKKLALGYNYLQTRKRVDFTSITARTNADRLREQARQEKMQRILEGRVKKLLKEMEETVPEIEKCLKEADSCFALLFPLNVEEKEQVIVQDVIHTDDEFADTQIDVPADLRQTKSDKVHAGQKCEPIVSEKVLTIGPEDLKHDGKSQESCRKVAVDLENHDTFELVKGRCQNGCEDKEESGQSLGVCSGISSGNRHEAVPEGMDILNLEGKCVSTDGLGTSVSVEPLHSSHSTAFTQLGKESSDEDASQIDPLQSHGVRSIAQNFTIDIDVPTDGVILVEDEDNMDVLSNLDDAKKLIITLYIPRLKCWIQDLTKAGNQPHHLRKCIDLKQSLNTVLQKYSELKVQRRAKDDGDSEDEEEDGDEFVDVPEKEGYEPHIPDHLREEYGLEPLDAPSTSTKCNPSPKPKSLKPGSSRKKSNTASEKDAKMAVYSKMHDYDWHPVLSFEHDAADPTSRAATIAAWKKKQQEVEKQTGKKFKKERKLEHTTKRPSSSPRDPEAKRRKVELLAQAPVVSFGADLEHWENPENMKVPVIMRPQTDNCIWTSHTNEDEVVLENVKDLIKTRVINFTGKFEPVKWKCRAPLPSGKLCERMDRLKCPFHGRIVGRDEQGNPSAPEHQEEPPREEPPREEPPREEPPREEPPREEQPTAESGNPPLWQDPGLLRDIAAATGVNLASTSFKRKKGSKGKGKSKKGKQKAEASSGLTNLKQTTNTPRARLEKQIFKASTMKRVNSVLTKIDDKRVRDKFANQFHYALKS